MKQIPQGVPALLPHEPGIEPQSSDADQRIASRAARHHDRPHRSAGHHAVDMLGRDVHHSALAGAAALQEFIPSIDQDIHQGRSDTGDSPPPPIPHLSLPFIHSGNRRRDGHHTKDS